jgi:hypothetical protein
MSEPLMQLLAKLPPTEPDPARAERIRLRCRAQWARQARHAPAAQRARARDDRPVQVWQPLIAVLGIAYLAQVIVQALRVYGLR